MFVEIIRWCMLYFVVNFVYSGFICYVYVNVEMYVGKIWIIWLIFVVVYFYDGKNFMNINWID